MKNFIIISSVFLGLFSCNKDTKIQTDETTLVEVPFTKEGELVLKNANAEIRRLNIEIADNEIESHQGLMNRSKLNENDAMLFSFDEPKVQTFYMKDTRIPLDLLYISKDSVVLEVSKNAKPYDETTIPSSVESQYVLEINGGLADKWGIIPNQTKVSWKRIN